MTDFNPRGPKRCKFSEPEEICETKEEALAALKRKQLEDDAELLGYRLVKSRSDVPESTELATDPDSPKERQVIVKIGKLHAVFWTLIVFSGMICSFIFAMEYFNQSRISATSLMGVLGTLVLAATVFSLSKDNVLPHSET